MLHICIQMIRKKYDEEIMIDVTMIFLRNIYAYIK